MRFFSLPPKNDGFSLLELLIVTVISLVILGGTLAGFISFNDRRAVLSAAGELKIYLESSQSKANAGDIGGCDTLAGYRVQTYLNGNVTDISSQAVCEIGTPDAAQIYSLSSGITISPSLDITYRVLHQGVDLGGSVSQDITLSGVGNSYLFTLFREGRISEGAWQ